LADLLIRRQGCRYPDKCSPVSYLVTRRCAQRQFLLRPDTDTNNAFTYCLIEAAQRCQVEVVLPCALSNHYHAVIFDRWGRYLAFLEHFTSCSHAVRMRCEGGGRTFGRRSRYAW